MAEERRRWTVIDLLKWTAGYLEEKNFAHARLNAERLLCHVLHWRRVDLYLQFDRPLSVDELTAFKLLLRRRLTHEPLQYIIGESEFFSLSFLVGPGVLIPRPETELLVEKAIEFAHPFAGCRILDLGTGSGCIAVSLAVHLPQAHIVAIDRSAKALELAQANARCNGVAERIEFLSWDFTSPTSPFTAAFDVVVANPPYVRESDYERLPKEIKNFEPPEALLAGQDGLDGYRAIQRRLNEWLNPGGRAFLEIGADQAEEILHLFPQANLLTDLAGRRRLAIIEQK